MGPWRTHSSLVWLSSGAHKRRTARRSWRPVADPLGGERRVAATLTPAGPQCWVSCKQATSYWAIALPLFAFSDGAPLPAECASAGLRKPLVRKPGGRTVALPTPQVTFGGAWLGRC